MYSTVYLLIGCAERHSDGAVNSYVTGTEMKDTYRPDSIDDRGIPCCSSEAPYHPDRLLVSLDYSLQIREGYTV